MKKILLSLTAALAVYGVNAQQWFIPNTHNTLVMKFTADWCGPCGAWGWNQTKALIDAGDSGTLNAVTVAVHTSSSTTPSLNTGGLESALAANLDHAFTGIPAFAVGEMNYDQANTAAITANVGTATASAAVANAGFRKVISGNTITVNTKTKFFAAASGEYYVGVYVYEDGIVAYQNNQGSNAVHHNVLRKTTGFQNFGYKLNGTSFAANQEIDTTFTMTIPNVVPAWVPAELHFFSVIWKKNGTKYEVVNVNKIESFTTSVENVNAMNDLQVYPNPATSEITVKASFDQATAATFSLVNTIGQTVYTQEVNNHSNAISHTIPVSNLSNGMYMLYVTSADGNKAVTRILVSK